MNVAQCIRLFRINPGLFNQIISRKGDNKYDLTAITMSIFVDMNKDEIIQFSNEIIKNRDFNLKYNSKRKIIVPNQ